MQTVLFALCTLVMLFPAVIPLAQENDFMKQVVDSIRLVCHAPGEQGRHWEVEATGKGDIKLKLLKHLPGAGINGEVRFSKGEWEGVQRVLREHQAGDNASYRQCVRELTPLFIENHSHAR